MSEIHSILKKMVQDELHSTQFGVLPDVGVVSAVGNQTATIIVGGQTVSARTPYPVLQQSQVAVLVDASGSYTAIPFNKVIKTEFEDPPYITAGGAARFAIKTTSGYNSSPNICILIQDIFSGNVFQIDTNLPRTDWGFSAIIPQIDSGTGFAPGDGIALSPDGLHLAFSAVSATLGIGGEGNPGEYLIRSYTLTDKLKTDNPIDAVNLIYAISPPIEKEFIQFCSGPVINVSQQTWTNQNNLCITPADPDRSLLQKQSVFGVSDVWVDNSGTVYWMESEVRQSVITDPSQVASGLSANEENIELRNIYVGRAGPVLAGTFLQSYLENPYNTAFPGPGASPRIFPNRISSIFEGPTARLFAAVPSGSGQAVNPNGPCVTPTGDPNPAIIAPSTITQVPTSYAGTGACSGTNFDYVHYTTAPNVVVRNNAIVDFGIESFINACRHSKKSLTVGGTDSNTCEVYLILGVPGVSLVENLTVIDDDPINGGWSQSVCNISTNSGILLGKVNYASDENHVFREVKLVPPDVPHVSVEVLLPPLQVSPNNPANPSPWDPTLIRIKANVLNHCSLQFCVK